MPGATASTLTTIESNRIPGVKVAGKTGTAQKDVYRDGKKGIINYAWFICFAPAGESRDRRGSHDGRRHSRRNVRRRPALRAGLRMRCLKKYFAKKALAKSPLAKPFKVE